jgi:hypothetical protein
LVKVLQGLIVFAATGGEKISFLPFKLLSLLDDISIGVGFSTREIPLSRGCEGPPSTFLSVI